MDPALLTHLLGYGTIALFLGALLLLGVYFLGARLALLGRLARLARLHGIATAFVLSILGSALTLYYSEIVGYPPCPLCWWQRVFLYPQVIILGIALYRRDASVALYSLALSTIGLCIAAYHHALQVLPSGSLPCPAEGAVSCAQRFVFEFGFITFPLMAAALFAFLGILMILVLSKRD